MTDTAVAKLKIKELPINEEFARVAENEEFARVAEADAIDLAITSLRQNGITAEFVPSAAQAKKKVLQLIPEGSEVMTETSKTLEVVGLTAAINESGNYNSVRQELNANVHSPQPRELKAKANLPEFAVGSVHAVTEDGQVMIASNTGSQMAAYVYGADHVIWVVGAQKLVKDLDQGLKRIYQYSYPLEDRRAQQAYGIRSNVSKILIINKEIRPGRVHMVIVGERLGF